MYFSSVFYPQRHSSTVLFLQTLNCDIKFSKFGAQAHKRGSLTNYDCDTYCQKRRWKSDFEEIELLPLSSFVKRSVDGQLNYCNDYYNDTSAMPCDNAPVSTLLSTPNEVDRRKAPRGSSFTTLNDEEVAKAWIQISEDDIVASDQKEELFFKAINYYYDVIKLSYCHRRIITSLERSVKKTLRELQAFPGCGARVHNARRSGTNCQDVLHLDTSLFTKRLISSVKEKCSSHFK